MDEIETYAERRLLYALGLMCNQYLGELHEGTMVLDHMWMTAGEEAFKLLSGYGLIEIEGRGATWTALGEEFMNSDLNLRSLP